MRSSGVWSRRTVGTALPHLVDVRFQVLFHSPLGVLFTCPSRYWFTIGHGLVFSLGRWSSRIPTGFHESRGTWEIRGRLFPFAYRAVTVYGGAFHPLRLEKSFVTPWRICNSACESPQHLTKKPCRAHLDEVWAVPLSLAATQGISVDLFSSGY